MGLARRKSSVGTQAVRDRIEADAERVVRGVVRQQQKPFPADDDTAVAAPIKEQILAVAVFTPRQQRVDDLVDLVKRDIAVQIPIALATADGCDIGSVRWGPDADHAVHPLLAVFRGLRVGQRADPQNDVPRRDPPAD